MTGPREPQTARRDEAGLGSSDMLMVSVRELAVQADIGVLPHEVGRPQPLVVSVTLQLQPFTSDRLAHTVDYRDVVDRTHALALERICLIETFAGRLAAACLDHPAVISAEVEVAKPLALSDGVASTRIYRRRAADTTTRALEDDG